MDHDASDDVKFPVLWALGLAVVLIVLVWTCFALFSGSFTGYVPITLTADRAGLVMEPGAKVRLRGVQVGHVTAISGGSQPVSLALDIDPDQVGHIPANVTAQIRATTAFGAKYVDLVMPDDPARQHLAAGAVITSHNVSTEVNTVFENLVGVLHQIDPAKLNNVLSALSEGLRGQGQSIGEAITDANQSLLALNPRAETVRSDWHSLQGFADTYGAAAQHLLAILDATTTTARTITDNASSLDDLLVNLTGLSHSGITLLGPNKDNLINGINVLEPTTRLLMKYNPELTCMLTGANLSLNTGFPEIAGGGNGKSLVVDAALLFGADPYKYPDNLPITGAKGGPGGKPSCGSLPDVAQNFPQRYLVTNTGWGTGLDRRPNPGIGFPGYGDFLPGTRATPQAPSVRYPGGPAPGPIPYPGAPPYGAPMYAPDGLPLYPGEPPAPPPGAAPEPGPPPPGSEPFVVPNPMILQPTPTPPLPFEATPAP